MGDVNLSIHGKAYNVACDDGQEARVADLGAYVDARLKEIAGAGAASSESHLLVLTALVLADEIHELRAALQNTSHDHAAQKRAAERDERQIVEAIQHLALRIDSVADRLQKAA